MANAITPTSRVCSSWQPFVSFSFSALPRVCAIVSVSSWEYRWLQLVTSSRLSRWRRNIVLRPAMMEYLECLKYAAKDKKYSVYPVLCCVLVSHENFKSGNIFYLIYSINKHSISSGWIFRFSFTYLFSVSTCMCTCNIHMYTDK